MTLRPEGDSRRLPAKVYPAVLDAEAWVVEAPASTSLADNRLTTFTGPTALARALEYAHRAYGSASYFSR